MNKQYYFIVYYDTATCEWYTDAEAEEMYMDNQTVYDPNTGQWEYGYLGELEYNDNNYTIANQLNEMLAAFNKRKISND